MRSRRTDRVVTLLCAALAFVCTPAVAAPPAVVPTPSPTPTPLPASEVPITLDLKECIRRAVAISPTLQAAIEDRRAMESRLREAKSAYVLPDVRLRVLGGVVPDVPDGSGPEADFPDVDTDLSELGPFIQLRVEAIQPLFTFGKLRNAKEAARQGVRAKEDQERAVTDELTRQVTKVYNGVQFLRATLDFLNELRDRAVGAQDRVKELLRKHSGDVTEIDLMRLNVFFGETDREAVQARNGISLGMATLGLLTGGLEGRPVSPTEAVYQFNEIRLATVDHYLERARATRPEIRQLDEMVAARQALMAVSKSDFFPMFFLGGYYAYGTAPGRQSVDNPFLRDDFNYQSGGVGLGLEQKLSFHLTDSRYGQASAEYRKALFDRDQALLGIHLEIRKAHSQATAKGEAVRGSREAFRAGRSWVTATTLNFGVGLVPVKDLLEAFVAYTKVKLGYLNTIREYDDAIADLNRAVGEPVGESQG